ncbi:MAG: ferritin [Sedimentisphaerales bacterium]|nr:ferritin [Sedimentisphaerales bacterium]
MISKKMEKAINTQMQREIYSASLYLAMSSYCSGLDLNGFANWYRIQAMEEMTHAMKFYDYIIEQSGKAIVPAVEQPPQEFDSPQATFEGALEHEKKVTAWINELVDIAIAEKDHATNIFLQWYVTEQVEEEAHANEILQKVKRIGTQGPGLFMIDQQLAQRVFTPPAAPAE